MVWACLVLAFAIPLLIAIIALAEPRWFPMLDRAQTEMRVRDVTTSHPPLVGLPGRIGTWDRQGSHPGPVSFWAIAPLYHLFGSSAWSMEAAAAVLNLLAVALALWIARRRGGTTLLLGLGLVLAILAAFYGPSLLTQPWNPYLPTMWFVPFMLAVWSVLRDDFAMMPVVAFAGSFCVQTHVPYAGLVLGLIAGATVWLAIRLIRGRADAGLVRRALLWALAALGVVAALWALPVYQQVTGSPGNLGLIWEHFTDPPGTAIGPQRGLRLMLVHLNPWRLIAGQDATSGSAIPGLLFFAVWAASTVVAWRRRAHALVTLDAVIAVEILLGVVSMGNIFGFVWYYLMLWAWGLCALMVLTIGWTTVIVARDQLDWNSRSAVLGLRTGLALGTLAVLVSFGVSAATVEQILARESDQLGILVRATVDALDSTPNTSRQDRYLVTYHDPFRIGSLGYGLLVELERAGYDAGFSGSETIVAGRVVDLPDASVEVHLAIGPADIAKWRAKPEMTEVAYANVRSPAEQRTYNRLRRDALRLLRRDGRSDLAALVDGNLFGVTFDPDTPPRVKTVLEGMLALPPQAAVFIGPPVQNLADR